MGINAQDFRTLIIRPTLNSINLYCASSENLLLGTAAVESGLGRYLQQQKAGPALGIYQIEKNTHYSIWQDFLRYRESWRNKIFNHLGFSGPKNINDETIKFLEKKLVTDLEYQTIIARLKYYITPCKMPSDANDIKALANIWKKYYNTDKGAGKASSFIDCYNKVTESLTKQPTKQLTK